MKNLLKANVILVNPTYRSMLIQIPEEEDNLVEIPISPISRDDSIQMATQEDLPKEGSRILVCRDRDYAYRMVQFEDLLSTGGQREDIEFQRKLTNTNVGDPLLNGLITSDLSTQDGFNSPAPGNFGSSDPLYKRDVGLRYNYAGSSFGDLIPGDKVIATREGNAIAVLEGGVNYFKASELCQIIGIKYNDLLRIVSRNFEHFTDFGNIVIENKDGAVSYVIDGGNSLPDVQAGRYRLRVAMGAAGDMIRIAVLDGNNGEVALFHMGSDGVINELDHGRIITHEGEYKETFKGGVNKKYGSTVNETYFDDVTIDIQGASEDKNITNNQKLKVNNDQNIEVGRVQTNIIGQGINTQINGGGDSKPYLINIQNGDHYSEIFLEGSFIRNGALFGSMVDTVKSGNHEVYIAKGDQKVYIALGNKDLFILEGDSTEELTLGSRNTTLTKGDWNLDVVVGDTNINNLLGNVVIKGGGTAPLANIISMTNNEVVIQQTENVGAKVKLSNGRVAIGTAGIEFLQLVDEFLQVVNTTETAIASHIHATVVGPTAPPNNSPLFNNLATQIMNIKSRLITIKGTL